MARNPNIRKVSEQARKYTEHENSKRFIKVKLESGVEATLDRVAFSRLPGREQNKFYKKGDANYNPFYDKKSEESSS